MLFVALINKTILEKYVFYSIRKANRQDKFLFLLQIGRKSKSCQGFFISDNYRGKKYDLV